jgi:hypothetical protein
MSEDEIFEATVCAAYRASVERYAAFQAALGDGDDAP